jgi:hypothetical protein
LGGSKHSHITDKETHTILGYCVIEIFDEYFSHGRFILEGAITILADLIMEIMGVGCNVWYYVIFVKIHDFS